MTPNEIPKMEVTDVDNRSGLDKWLMKELQETFKGRSNLQIKNLSINDGTVDNT